MNARAIAIALSVAAVPGCAVLSGPDPEPATAVLSKIPTAIPTRAAGSITLLVFPPQADAAYETTRMAYARAPHEIEYFREHRWAAPPAKMLHPLVLRTLEATGYFKAIVAPPYTGNYSYSLRTELIELVQDFASRPPVLRLSLRVRLSDDAKDRLVDAHDIVIHKPMKQETAEAGVAAANDAIAKALQEIARFSIDKAN